MANINRKSASVDAEAERLWDMFDYSVTEQQDDIDRMIDMRKTLDASVDETTWPTQSKLPLAEAWATTEAALGPALEYLYPSSKFITMLPLDGVDNETREKVGWALYVQLMYRMKLKYATARSIRNSLSVSLGYGIIEPITVVPPASFEVVVGNNRTRQMGDGRAVRGLRYRDLSPGKVIPYPSGTDFNGDDATPAAFFLDFYPEQQFRNLYLKGATGGEDILLKGDPEDIIAATRTVTSYEQATLADFVDQMAGRKTATRTRSDKRIPVLVPVLKCYEDGKHTWVFCGARGGKMRSVIFEDESFTARRKPLIKWDPWIDSDRWYPMSLPEADMHNVWAKNVWYNAIFDLFTYGLKRSLVYDSTSTDPQEAAKLLSPRGMAGFPGDVNKAVRFLDGPNLGADMVQFGDVIDANRRRITGERDFTERNFTRGGSFAFQDLVQSSTGRERLRHALLQMGGMSSIAEQTLIYMQTLGDDMDLRFQRPAYKEGKDYIEQFSITPDDLRHAYDMVIDLDSKHRFGSMDAQMEVQLYDRKIRSPYFDHYEVSRKLCLDDVSAQQEVLPRDVVRRKQAESERASIEAQRLGIEKRSASMAQNSVAEGALAAGA